MIWKVLLPEVTFSFQNLSCKANKAGLSGNSGKFTSHKNFNLRFLWKTARYTKRFFVWKVWQPGVAIQPNLTMIKQIIWDWLGNNVQMTLHCNFKRSSSKRIWYSIKVFLFQSGVNQWPWLPGVINFLKIGHPKCPNWRGSNGKMTSQNSLKLRFPKSSQVAFIEF